MTQKHTINKEISALVYQENQKSILVDSERKRHSR